MVLEALPASYPFTSQIVMEKVIEHKPGRIGDSGARPTAQNLR
jgi:hypothetical protein